MHSGKTIFGLILGLTLGMCLQTSHGWTAPISCTSNGPGTDGWTTTVVDDHYKTSTQLSYCDAMGDVVGPICSGITPTPGRVSCPRGYRCEKADFTGLGRCAQGAALQPTCTSIGTIGSTEGWTLQRSDASGFNSTVLSRCSDDGAKIVGYSCTGNGGTIQEATALCPRGTFCQTNSRTGASCIQGTPAPIQCVHQKPNPSGWKWRITNASKITTVFQAQCNANGTALEGSTCLNGSLVPHLLECPQGTTCSSEMCSPPAPAQQQFALSITNYTAPIVQKDSRSGNQSLALIDGAKLISCLGSSGYQPQTRETGSGGFIQTILVYPDPRTPLSTFQTCVQNAVISSQPFPIRTTTPQPAAAAITTVTSPSSTPVTRTQQAAPVAPKTVAPVSAPPANSIGTKQYTPYRAPASEIPLPPPRSHIPYRPR